jgi:hypothetical protein
MKVHVYSMQAIFEEEEAYAFAKHFDFSDCGTYTFELSLKYNDYIDTIQDVDIYKCLFTGSYLFIKPK